LNDDSRFATKVGRQLVDSMALQQYESRRVFERLGGSLMVVDVTVEIRAGQE